MKQRRSRDHVRGLSPSGEGIKLTQNPVYRGGDSFVLIRMRGHQFKL